MFCRMGYERAALPALQLISGLCVTKFKEKVAPFLSSASDVVLSKLCVQLSVTECLAARFISR